MPRDAVEADLAQLSKVERRALRELGVRIGAHTVWLPHLQARRARSLLLAHASGLPRDSAHSLAAHGQRQVAGQTIPVLTLERFAEARRAAKGGPLSDEVLSELGWTADQAKAVSGALKKTAPKESRKPERAAKPVKDSPFAALASLGQVEAPVRRKRRRSNAR